MHKNIRCTYCNYPMNFSPCKTYFRASLCNADYMHSVIVGCLEIIEGNLAHLLGNGPLRNRFVQLVKFIFTFSFRQGFPAGFSASLIFSSGAAGKLQYPLIPDNKSFFTYIGSPGNGITIVK
jgi:hypothetical protein